MARATSAETAERVEHLQGMILTGQHNTECLAFARQTWGGVVHTIGKYIIAEWKKVYVNWNKAKQNLPAELGF